MSSSPTILFTIPEKRKDPTFWTAKWARKAVELAKSLGYRVIVLEKEQTTHDKVSELLQNDSSIRLYAHYGHGCVNSLQGQNQCIISRKYTIAEISEMALSRDPEKIRFASLLLEPLGYLSNPTVCQLNSDPCELNCRYDTNVGLLKNKIVFTTACFSAGGLGKCAIRYGADSYQGFEDLYLFPVDHMGSQNMYEHIQLVGLKEILLGHSVEEAELAMNAEENRLIRKYKPIKYIALTLLWNKLNRRLLGNKNTSIFG